jgi:ketosteroid isomerase-like protein
MRSVVALLSLMLVPAPIDLVMAQSNQAEIITAIDAASGTLDEAFVAGDAEGIRSMMTEDHIAVTPFYADPLSVDEQIASLTDLTGYNQTVVGNVSVSLLSPDVALRTFEAKLEGSYKGNPLPSRVFINETLVKRNELWIERFYQVTTLPP